MAYNRLSNYATAVFVEDGWTKVIYHNTCIIKWNNEEVVLNSGGYRSVTTKKKINQAANQFCINIGVVQRKGDWYVTRNGGPDLPFEDNMTLRR